MTSWITDTHALVWHVSDPRKVGSAARRAFAAVERGEATCRVSTIVLIEVALLNERGRLAFGPAQLLEQIGGHPGYVLLPTDLAQALEFAALPGLRDPWDRLILAAARATRTALLSADEALEGYGVRRIWD